MYSTIVPVIVEAKKREVKNPNDVSITVNRRVTGWQSVTLSREGLEEIVRRGEETVTDYEARLDAIWKAMVIDVGAGEEYELDSVSADDIGIELDDIDYDDSDLTDWIGEWETEYEEQHKKCVLTGETKTDWNEGDEMVETTIGPMRDIYADVLPKIVELLNKKDESKQKEKDKEIERLKEELKKATEQLAGIKKAIW